MPVVRIDLKRFPKMVGAERSKILERLPYVGLDIESVEKDSVRVEYSPNRPDFGTDFGIARALRGLMGKETGLPRFRTSKSGVAVSVDRRLSKIRPFIVCATAGGLSLDEEDVRQLISLQEDLHNGLGRKRRTVAIGLHDMDKVAPPISYRAVPDSFRFVPLDGHKALSISAILSDTKEGKAYGGYFSNGRYFPLIADSKGVVLSFPPIINGNATKVTTKTSRMFIEVTGTNQRACDDVLAVITTTLAEMDGRIGTVTIKGPGKPRTTPDLRPIELPFDEGQVESVLGLGLSRRDMVSCLARSRLGVKGGKVLGPRYRIDLLHPIDVAEEVALGYGMDKIGPIYPPSKRPGKFNQFEEFLDSVSTTMAGSGMTELMTFELTDSKSLYTNFGRHPTAKISVENPKSSEHSLLRDALVPGLMSSLSANIKSDYPQRVYEIGRVFERDEERVSEAWHLGSLVAHSQASFTEAKMYLVSACEILSGRKVLSTTDGYWAFSPGRCAAVQVDRVQIGHVGEIEPFVVDAFGLGVPVAGFEISLSKLFELLK